MYSFNLMANAIYLNQPAAETKVTENVAANTNLLKQEAPKDSFEKTAPKRPTVKVVKEDFSLISLVKMIFGKDE